MKLLLRIQIAACCCLLSFQQLVAQSTKTLHQTFTTDDADKIVLNVVGDFIEVRETKGSRVLVEVSVKISIPNDRLLDYVINSGRYNLSKSFDPASRELSIESPKSNNIIVIKGKEVREEVKYIFYLPSSLRYANMSTLSNESRE